MLLPKRFSVLEVVCAVLLGWFFVHFHAAALGSPFTGDDALNLWRVWSPPFWQVALAQIALWSKIVRPLSAIYYLPIFSWFGFSPVPFNAARILLLALNSGLFYLFAKRLVRRCWVAGLAAFPVAYHAEL